MSQNQNVQTTWQTIFQDIKDEFGEDLDELTLIRAANRVLNDLRTILTLPTQIRTERIGYVSNYEKYKLPDDYREEGFISLSYQNKTNNDRNRTFIIQEPPFPVSKTKWNVMEFEQFLRRLHIDQAAFDTNQGLTTLYLANGKSDQNKIELSSADSLDGWAGSGGAQNLTLDTDVKAFGDASIKYDVVSTTEAVLTLTIDAVDASLFVDKGIIRFFKWLPTSPTQIEIRIGSSTSAYWTETITTQADGAIFDNLDENELEFSFRRATKVGTPDKENMVHFQVRMTFASAVTDEDFRIDDVQLWNPEFLIFKYYSKFMVKPSVNSTAWQELLTENAGTEDIPLILDEWRDIFVKGILIKSGLLDDDSRVAGWKEEYGGYDSRTGKWSGWIGFIRRSYRNRQSRIGAFYW